MITYVKGDATLPIVKDNVRILPHISNDVGGWGAGYVLALSRRWKEPEARYRKETDRSLGDIQVVSVTPSNGNGEMYVVNMIAQHGYVNNINPVAVRYDALETCFNKIDEWIYASISCSVSIHMPYIGCGLAGGNWEEVEKIIDNTLSDYDVYVYALDR